MNLTRSTFLVAGLALLASACGDDVTVTETPAPTPVAIIRSVSVAPATATVNTGASITFQAAVVADPGLTPTITWSASAGTITSAGVFTAPATANPGIAVCATATAGTQTARGCGTVVVSAPPAVVPATVSIQSVTTGNFNTPVNPANVANQIDIRLNINPGNQVVQRVVLLVGNVRADSQVFTAAQAAEMRYLADQTVFPQVVFSINTACYAGNSACPASSATAGTPRFLNGNQIVSAQLFTTTGGTTSSTATAQSNMVFNNVNGFHAALTVPNSANDANGFRWSGNGALIINLRPVLYTGGSVGSVITTFANSTGCAAAVPAAVTQLASATTAANPIDTLSLTGFQYALGGGCTGTTPQFPSVSATDANGTAMTLVANGIINSAAYGSAFGIDPMLALRWDNVAPASPTINWTSGTGAMPNNRTGSWLNDAVTFNGLATSAAAAAAGAGAGVTSNNLICNNASAFAQGNCAAGVTAPADAGVGGTTYDMRVAQSNTFATVTAASAITNPAALAASSLNNDYCGVAYSVDALGNRSANSSVGSTSTTCAGQIAALATNVVRFGVDRAAPTGNFSTVVAANMAANTGFTALTQMRAIAVDTGLVGNSGFIPGTSVASTTSTISRRITTGASAGTSTTAVTATSAAASATNVGVTRVDGSVPVPPVADTLVYDFSAIATDAYYTLTSVIADQAGNSVTISRTVARDATAPVTTVPFASNAITAGGSVTFTSTATDNLDLRTGGFNLGFPAASFSNVVLAGGAVVGAAPATYAVQLAAPTTFNSFNTAPAVTSGTLTGTVSAYYALQGMTDSVTMAAMAFPTSVNPRATDMAANANVATPLAPANPAAPTAFAIGTELNKFLVTRSGATVNVAGSTTVGAVFSRTLQARIEGSTTMAAPFSSVSYWILPAGAVEYQLLGTGTLLSQTDNGGLRTWLYNTVTFAPDANFAAGAATIVAVGQATGGRALMGQGNQITVAP